jgi:hypothetical protein
MITCVHVNLLASPSLTWTYLQIVISWVVTQCSLVQKYQCFGEKICFPFMGRKFLFRTLVNSSHKNGDGLCRLPLSALASHSVLSLSHSRSWALLEKLPIVQLLKNFPGFYGTQMFITVFKRAFHWSLSWARSIQFTPSHLPKIHFNIVHPPTSWSSRWSLSFWLSHQYPTYIPLLPYSCCMACPSHPHSLDHSDYTRRRVQVMKLFIMQFSPTSHHFSSYIFPVYICKHSKTSERHETEVWEAPFNMKVAMKRKIYVNYFFSYFHQISFCFMISICFSNTISSSFEILNTWGPVSTSPYALMVWCSGTRASSYSVPSSRS